eukprot:gene5572-5629_t
MGTQRAGHHDVPARDRLGDLVMKKFLLSAAVVALTAAAPAYAASGNTSSDTGSAAANVVTPIVLTHATAAKLNFGSFTTGSGGSVTVAADSTGSVSGDVGFVPGSLEAADQFSVKGDVNRSFSISSTGGTVANGSSSMSFTTAASATSGTLSAAGTATFTVGGTLTVTGSEIAGAYTGTYNATVAYN